MKIKIEKVTKIEGSCFFYLYADGKYITCEPFKVDEPDNSIYNETTAFNSILKLGKALESGKMEMVQTVYEKTEDLSETLQSLSNIKI